MAPEPAYTSLQLHSTSASETREIASLLACLLRAGDLVCLEGELGAGKTCFAQGLGRGLGVRGRMISPTFTLIREYATALPSVQLYHVDLYRVQSDAEALALGIEDYLYGDGICVVEWADRIPDLLPSERVWVALDHIGESERVLQMVATGSHHERALGRLARILRAPSRASCAVE